MGSQAASDTPPLPPSPPSSLGLHAAFLCFESASFAQRLFPRRAGSYEGVEHRPVGPAPHLARTPLRVHPSFPLPSCCDPRGPSSLAGHQSEAGKLSSRGRKDPPTLGQVWRPDPSLGNPA